MKPLTYLMVSIALLTTSCMKSNMPEPARTNTPCDSENAHWGDNGTIKEKKPMQNTRPAE